MKTKKIQKFSKVYDIDFLYENYNKKSFLKKTNEKNNNYKIARKLF